MANSRFQLIDLGSDFAFEFPFFPENIRMNGRANWEPQNTTIGVKPLFYGNCEPMRISVQDLHLDSTETATSLKPDLDLLRLFKTELEEGGPPPAMMAIWGDHNERCVLEELTIEQILFDDQGNCIRAKIGIELIELQPEGEASTVTVIDEPTVTEDIF
jgi:Contractile injection system tube protein